MVLRIQFQMGYCGPIQERCGNSIMTTYKLLLIVSVVAICLSAGEKEPEKTCRYLVDTRNCSNLKIYNDEICWIENDAIWSTSRAEPKRQLVYRCSEGRITDFGIYNNQIYLSTDYGNIILFNRESAKEVLLRKISGPVEDIIIKEQNVFAASVLQADNNRSHPVNCIIRMAEKTGTADTIVNLNEHILKMMFHKNALYFVSVSSKKEPVTDILDDIDKKPQTTLSWNLHKIIPGEDNFKNIFQSPNPVSIECDPDNIYLISDSLVQQVHNGKITPLPVSNIKKFLAVSKNWILGISQKDSVICFNRISGKWNILSVQDTVPVSTAFIYENSAVILCKNKMYEYFLK